MTKEELYKNKNVTVTEDGMLHIKSKSSKYFITNFNGENLTECYVSQEVYMPIADELAISIIDKKAAEKINADKEAAIQAEFEKMMNGGE